MKIRIDKFIDADESLSAEDFEFQERIQKKKKKKENISENNIYKKEIGKKHAQTSLRPDSTE